MGRWKLQLGLYYEDYLQCGQGKWTGSSLLKELKLTISTALIQFQKIWLGSYRQHQAGKSLWRFTYLTVIDNKYFYSQDMLRGGGG